MITIYPKLLVDVEKYRSPKFMLMILIIPRGNYGSLIEELKKSFKMKMDYFH